jgi:hypothetical protein
MKIKGKYHSRYPFIVLDIFEKYHITKDILSGKRIFCSKR